MNKKGFLLLEVIVTIALLTGGLIYVMRVYSVAKYAIQRSSVLFQSGLLLEDKIFEFEEKGKIKDYFKGGKDFPENRDYSWKINAEPAPRDPVLARKLDLDVVNLEVSRRKDSVDKKAYVTKYSITTYLNSMKQ